MATYILKLTLLSEATFGRGDGVAGYVDTEVEHDDRGLPYLHGRGVKGLLTAQCADILGALESLPAHSKLAEAATRLFGEGGSDLRANGALSVGPALLPRNLREAVEAVEAKHLSRTDVLEALTTIRRQTSIDEKTGAARENTLRSVRVLIRGLVFEATLNTDRDLDVTEQAVLAACVKAIRRVGTHRSRGLGRVQAELYDADDRPMHDFAQEIQQ
jgi:CRISPR/Cas system CSM-associated protein Csm3 (group 7 of RAMP superfamily)